MLEMLYIVRKDAVKYAAYPRAMKRSILLVENEPAQRELVRHVLEPRGYEITEAADGAAAIKKLTTGDFSVILLDLRMPHASGEVVIQWVVSNRPEIKPRILVVTGDVLSPGLDAFLERVGIPMLSKPYLLADLIEAVEKVVAATEKAKTNKEV